MNHAFVLSFSYLNAGEVYDETDYPTRIVDGESWRPFWWYNSTIGWPLDETDTLGGNI